MNPRPEHEHLSAWLDGELSDADAAELEAELAGDPELQAELDALEAVVQFVRREGPAMAPLNFHHQMMAKIDAEFPERTSSWAWLRRPWGIPLEGLVLAAAAAAVLLLLVPDWREAETAPETQERPLSPAAFELPTPDRPDLTQQAPVKLESESKPTVGGTVEVIGRATTEPTGSTGKSLPSLGTSKPAPMPINVASKPVPVAPPEPQAPAPRGTSAELPEPTLVPLRYVIASDDPAMKRELLSVAARFGGAKTVDRQPIESASLADGSEMLVTVLQKDLPKFNEALRRLGYEMITVPADELAGGDTIDVLLTLSQQATIPQAAPLLDSLDATQNPP